MNGLPQILIQEIIKYMIKRIIRKLRLALALRNKESYIKYLRSKGVKIGKNCILMDYKSVTIDITRPSLVTIGDNVLIHRNFTLLTHDFVTRRFLEQYNDFIPSSGKVTIGNNVSFGMDCKVLKGVTIGDNCFIATGSIVTSNIPSNSIAGGSPCKVISTIEDFYKFRKEAYKEEAYIYAKSIQERFGRRPIPADFWEEFPLFVDKSNIDQYPEIPIQRQLKGKYPEWIKSHKALFSGFDEFIEYALNYTPNRHRYSEYNSERNIPEDILTKIRNIVSSCVKTNLTKEQDTVFMDEIYGWDSLCNMQIIVELEKTFSIKIPDDMMFAMTSVYSIAETICSIVQIEDTQKAIYKNISSLYPHSKLWGSICNNIENTPHKSAIKINGTNITYTELYENVCKCATFLQEQGVQKGDRIILSAHKDIEYLYLYFASHIIGSTNVIVDAESNKDRLNYIEQKIKPKICFGYTSDSFKSILFKDIDLTKYSITQQVPYFCEISNNDIAEILFTTGTTGAPKGVCLSYDNIFHSATNINGFIQNTANDIELLALPICHSFGMGRIRCSLIKGATIVILGSFTNVKKLLQTIETENITGFGVVPAAWEYIRKISGTMIQKYAHQIKFIEIGSAAMSIERKEEMVRMFPETRICMHYGLTEASRSCFQEFHDKEHLSSIGKPVSKEVQVKIFDKDGNEMPNNTEGEICVKGNMVLSRYLEEKDNATAFHDTFFRTGDYGYIDEDGNIYLKGREKEMINVGGKKVSPMEVEEAIIALGVKDCVCIPERIDIIGETVKCYIIRGGTELSFEEIAKKLSTRLETYKQPTMYEWIDTIPYTDSGKKQRTKLIKSNK